MFQTKSSRFSLALIAVSVAFTPAAKAQLQSQSQSQSKDSQSQQTDSVAEAARRAREAKKNAAKPAKVVNNDDIDAKKTKGGVDVGSAPRSDSQPPNSGEVAAAEAADQAATAPAKPTGKSPEEREIAQLKNKIEPLAKQLDLMRRELALDKDTFYSKTDFARDTEGKAKLDAQQQAIDEKQPELDALNARLAELEQQLKDKGVVVEPEPPKSDSSQQQ